MTYKRVVYQLFDIKIQIFLKTTLFYALYRSVEIAPTLIRPITTTTTTSNNTNNNSHYNHNNHNRNNKNDSNNYNDNNNNKNNLLGW